MLMAEPSDYFPRYNIWLLALVNGGAMVQETWCRQNGYRLIGSRIPMAGPRLGVVRKGLRMVAVSDRKWGICCCIACMLFILYFASPVLSISNPVDY